MKNKLLLFLSSSLLLVLLGSCKKEENKIYFEGGTNPVFSANKTGVIPMSFATKDQEAVKLSWTNPGYKFTTGLSSQNVSYQIEIDTTGANFTNPSRKILSISQNLSLSLTQNELNDYILNQLQLVVSIPHNIEMRVRSTIGSAVPLYSNVLKFSVTPYAIPPKVNPPSTGNLYLVGSATPGGWNNPVPVPSQQFTKVSTTLFVINSIALTGGGSYLFLPLNGDWGTKYGALGANNTNNVNEDDFKIGGGDMLAPPVSGNYKIEVDFQRGKFKLTKL